MMKMILYGIKALCSYPVYELKRRTGSLIKPRFLNFIATYECNSKCVMCNIWKRDSKGELSAARIKEIFLRDRDFLNTITNIGVTGGEAFLRKDIVDIVLVLREIFPKAAIGVQTNGLLPELIGGKIAKIISNYPDFNIAVSLDGIGKTHDKIRGVPGAFEKALSTIERAKREGVKRITTGFTITPENYKEILPVRDLANKYGCEFSCFMPDVGDYFNNEANSYQFTPEMIKEICDSLKYFRGNYYMDNLRMILEGKKKRTLPCYSGFTSLTVDPSGNVKPCLLRKEVYGNIGNNSMKDILSSDKAKQIRKSIKNCMCCWSQCESSTSALVAPFDVLSWFVRYADKKAFVKDLRKKSSFLLKRV